ncbi:MAG TPA: response regulator [Pyrinomonadaceae bacterium]|nr:response regulator [Pyrinomonadaceae bacterium]
MNTTTENAAPAPPPHVPALPAHAGTVLLAEDDRALRRYLEVVLQRAGYAVFAAADGLEAMKAALSSTFDAVVTDAVMPHLGGHELCRFLRRHPKLASLPVVLLSGADQTAAPSDASERADVYLFKPVSPEELAACLAGLIAPTRRAPVAAAELS